jgi:hypothetical protein
MREHWGGVTSHRRLVAALAGPADVEDPKILADDLTVIFEGVLASAWAFGTAVRPRKDGRCRGRGRVWSCLRSPGVPSCQRGDLRPGNDVLVRYRDFGDPD